MINIANENEFNYVQALSRPNVVEAYSSWMELSSVEKLLLDQYVKPGSKIIDLGCGTGRIVDTMNPATHDYLGIDCSKEMIDAAKKLFPKYKFICDDILNVVQPVELFDVVLLMNNVVDMLNPYERRLSVFNLCKTYLNSNGVLIYSSHLSKDANWGYCSEDYHGATVHTYRAAFSQLCAEIEGLGFEICIAARDYRSKNADWAYIAAKIKI
jgi:2-polyprenyl-3-methyl-5-hydroxy-6-metoxy-1,4-benzoquinol methylase